MAQTALTTVGHRHVGGALRGTAARFTPTLHTSH